MATIVPNEGQDWYRDRALDISGADSEKIYDVGVGSGSTSVALSDTQLDTLEHRSNDDNSNVTIEAKSGTGEYECKITVSGGTEVSAGTDITELGVWARDPSLNESDFDTSGSIDDANDYMVYREVRSAITITSGDSKTFSITITITEN